jgi:tyrosine-protein phosphatase YwqE
VFSSQKINRFKRFNSDNHVDIHSHLLPGIDDGARTFEDSLRLTQALQSFGITQIITTSYYTACLGQHPEEIQIGKR